MLLCTWGSGLAYAQEAGLWEGFQPNRPRVQGLLQTEGAWAANQPVADIDSYDLSITAAPGLDLHHNYKQSLVQHNNALLGKAWEEKLIDGLSLELTPRTKLAISQETSTLTNLQQTLLSGTESRTVSLIQAFGSGDSSGSLHLAQTKLQQFSGAGDPQELTTHIMALQTGLGEGYDLAAKLTNTDSPKVIGLHRHQVEASLALPFSGGDGQIAFSKLTESEGIHDKQVKTTDLVAPLALFGGQGKAEFHQNITSKDGQETEERTVRLFCPLESVRSGSSLSYSLEPVHRKNAPTQQVRTTAFQTPLGFLGTTGDLSLKRITVREPNRYEHGYDAHLTTQVQGQSLSLRTRVKHISNNGTPETVRQLTLDTPTLHLLGDETTLEYHLHITKHDDQEVQRPRLAFATPLHFMGDKAGLTHSIEQIERKRKPTQELRTTALQVPFNMFGTPAKFEQNRMTMREPNQYEIRYRSYLTILISGEPLELERQAINIPTDNGINRQRRFFIQTPKFQLFTDWAGIKGNHLINEYSQRSTQRSTNINLTAQPIKRLDLAANYQIQDDGPGQTTRFRKVTGRLDMGKHLALNARFEQHNSQDDSATSLRHLYLTKDKIGASSLGVQVGYITWGGPGKDWAPANDVRFAWGDPEKLDVKLQFTEYDQKKWQRLDQPVVRLALEHGAPQGLNMKLEYADQPGRPARERGLHFALPALGGTMQLGYVEHPLDRHGKNVLPATWYDFGLSRQVFGDITLDVGYRYCDFSQPVSPEQVTQFLKLKIVGGQETKGGKVDISYLSGDFVPQPNPKKPVPASVLDLKYTREWGDRGRLILTLQRRIPPANAHDLERSCEGRLEYSMAF